MEEKKYKLHKNHSFLYEGHTPPLLQTPLLTLSENEMKEAIYGRNAFVYHRTGSRIDDHGGDDTNEQIIQVIKTIKERGFKIGAGAVYGPGLYTTYELKSQLRKTMRYAYGPVILKFFLKFHNILVLEPKQAVKIYGRGKEDLIKQLEGFKLKSSGLKVLLKDPDFMETVEFHREGDYKSVGGKTSSVAARITSLASFNLLIRNRMIGGIIFNGNQDGMVAVIYNPNEAAIFQSFAYEPDGDGKTLKWIDAQSMGWESSFRDRQVEFQGSLSMKGADISKYDKSEFRLGQLLHGKNVKALSGMLKAGVMSVDMHLLGKSLIFHLIDQDDADWIKVYLKHGGSLLQKHSDSEWTYDPKTNKGKSISGAALTPIFYAIANGKVKALKGLMNWRFFNPDYKEYDMNLLQFANQAGSEKAFDVIVDYVDKNHGPGVVDNMKKGMKVKQVKVKKGKQKKKGTVVGLDPHDPFELAVMKAAGVS